MFEWLLDNQWILYMAVAYASFKTGWKIHEVYIMYIITEHPERIEKVASIIKTTRNMTDDQTLEFLQQAGAVKQGFLLRVEQVGQMFYAYHDEQFVSQGASLNEVVTLAKQRYPDREFLAEVISTNSTK